MSSASYVDDLVVAATREHSAVSLVTWFMNHLGDEFNDALFLFTFGPAFRIPVTVLYRALDWQGFRQDGPVDDAAMEELLAPWIWPGTDLP